MQMTHHLDDKYTATSGSAFMTGTQALVRLPMAQMRRDHAAGLNTAAFITGYRGSPLGAYDQQLIKARDHLAPLDITFQPGVNEDLAATAIWGTQQVGLSEQRTHDGVFGIWYGKGPGVDRCGDVFKHGNAAGSAALGGVLCLAGDDHAAKSSTVPHQSDHAFMAAVMPMLYPSSVHEFIEVGLLGVAMSRYSGCWLGMKVISDTVETSAVVSLDDELKNFVLPDDFDMPEGGLNLRWPDPPLVQDERIQQHKAYAALAFARANRVDYTVFDTPNARIGIMASGKAYEDVRQALTVLGITQAEMALIGLKLYKVRMPWPLEPEGVRAFSEGLEEVLVIEERREMIEFQIKQQLFNWRADVRPRIVGKFDENDAPFLPLSTSLSQSRVVRAIAERLLRLDFDESLKNRITEKLDYLQRRADERAMHISPVERQPWFCSGCPHNTSTKVPEGSTAMAGIGCHYMVQWMDRSTATFTQMGGEGASWNSLSQYTRERHRFVNIGDGTYYHSGVLAIRSAVASGANVTYKVLYNDAVAMTGGQPVDGDLTPEQITWQLHGEGVRKIALVSDEPDLYDINTLAPGVAVEHRDALDSVMRDMRIVEGCTAIVYAQTCAAEKRRRRKRGLLEDPARRVVINPAVCEGCGDCSVKSNCVSVEPLETAFGRKRRINQSSCNKDYSCVKGFCPSFVSVYGGQLKQRTAQALGDVSGLSEPTIPELGTTPYNIAVTGVGGTGVLTIGALLGMAAHVDGKASMVLDMAGLAQKGGAVISHVRLAATADTISSPHIVAGAANVMLAADDVVAASRDAAVLCDSSTTDAVVNTSTAPVSAFVLNRDYDFQHHAIKRTLLKVVRDDTHFKSFSQLAEVLCGDTIATNIMMLGYTWQQGLVPLSFIALDSAIQLNGVAVEKNREAFAWGRRLAAEPTDVVALVEALEKSATAEENESSHDSRPIDTLSLDELIQHRVAHLTAYQNKPLATRFESLVQRVRDAVARAGLDDAVTRAVAINYSRVLAYKDEYEVARLLSDPSFLQSLEQQFDGDCRIQFHLAPPLLSGKTDDGRPAKRTFGRRWLPVFAWLAKGKAVRGTPLDLFGLTAERRAERRWIKHYEADVERLLGELDASKSDLTIAILSIPSEIRGFGPVKKAAMQEAEIARDKLWADYARPKAVDLTQQAA